MIDPRQFREALGAFTTGVTVVTTRDAQGRDVGLTANSFNSVSLSPPMVLWSLARTSSNLRAFVEAPHFAVHILAADQEPLSVRFSKRDSDRFAGLALRRGHGDVPLLEGCAARFECRTAFRHEGGDHEIFVGEVITFEHFERAPLVFHGGGYAMAVAMPKLLPNLLPTDDEGSFGHESLAHLLAKAADRLRTRLESEEKVAARHHVPLGVDDIGRIAAGKAAEEDACRGMTESEVRMLKHLLKRLLVVDGKDGTQE